MPIDVVMPRLSDTMEEGTLTRWLKQPGDPVSKGEAIAEVETDKATMEVEAFDEGTLGEVLVQEGDSVPVGQPIARLNGEAETAQEKPSAAEEKPETSKKEIKTEAAQKEVPSKDMTQEPEVQQPEFRRPHKTPHKLTGLTEWGGQEATRSKEPLSPSERRKRRQLEHPPEQPFPEASKQSLAEWRINASPRARKVASEQGVDLARLQGRGPEGRIVEADVWAFLEQSPQKEQRQPTERTTGAPSKMRQAIARQMSKSKQQIPHFYVTSVVRGDALVRLRSELKRQFNLSYNDLIIKACALALRQHERLNALWQNEQPELSPDINIAFAVAVPDGLLTPVVHQADRRSLEKIAQQTRKLAERSRKNELQAGDLSGGTFTISNMGMAGVESFSAIINPPQVAILAVGGIREVPVVENGTVIPGLELRLTLSGDHRAFNGIEAAAFLETLKHLLENPVLLSEANFISELSLQTHARNGSESSVRG